MSMWFQPGPFRLAGDAAVLYAVTISGVADGREGLAFVNLNLKIGHGRDMALKQEVAGRVFAILCDWMKPITDASYCQISFELTELDPVLKFNKNNLHPLFQPT